MTTPPKKRVMLKAIDPRIWTRVRAASAARNESPTDYVVRAIQVALKQDPLFRNAGPL